MKVTRRTLVGVLAVCILTPAAWAAPVLELSMTGPATALPGQEITLQVDYSNTEQGLGGLYYELTFSEMMDLNARDYASFGWVHNDGVFDNSSPTGGSSLSDSLSSITFDTVVDPAGSEFTAGSSGTVETFRVKLSAETTERYITFDIMNATASDGAGTDWEGATINGSIDVVQSADPNVAPHTYGVLVPEPVSFILCLAGAALAATRRRR